MNAHKKVAVKLFIKIFLIKYLKEFVIIYLSFP